VRTPASGDGLGSNNNRKDHKKERKSMLSFEEYVLFQALDEGTKKALAEKFARKRLTPGEIAAANSFGTSIVDVWAQKQLNSP
jgi:hypothetical protein